MSFAIDIAEELTIPLITFRTFSACCTWTYFHLTKLIEEGEVPFQGAGDVDMDKTITCIPGLEGTLRCRDLPGICRRKEANDPLLQFFIKETAAMPRASGLILNTFDRLEASMISKLGSFFSNIYTLGPLQGLSDTFAKSPSARTSSNGLLWKEDRGCITWLDSHPSRSVIYVSFGSLVGLFRDQLLEFWHGLVNSGKPFLWVIRSDSIMGEDGVSEVPLELIMGEDGVNEFAGMARDSVKEGGSSYSNLQKLIEDIKSMSLAGKVSLSSVG
ncbi:hypothetical protein POTOM_051856 [Populus tomentosa]|uniref:Uncharacterized protein n=1 Tax=Populus tomentosa TaxID=118781 RepID=A0A8X7Y6B2_POPTO|nr:hypothetical protein POTOM_051856 [Populus tomentosa]